MNGYNVGTKVLKTNSEETNESEISTTTESSRRYSVYWDYAISINMSTIVYLHCHQHSIKSKKKYFHF